MTDTAVDANQTQEAQRVIDHIDDLVRESKKLRDVHEAQWDQNLRRYLGDQWDRTPPKGLHQYTVNFIQNACIATAAIETEQTPEVALPPRETNEPPVWVDEQGNEVPEDLVATLPVQPDPRTGQPVPMGVVPVTDAFVASSLKLHWDIMWEKATGDQWLTANVLNTACIGHQPTLVQWNDQTECFELTDLHQLNCYIDPWATQNGIPSARYFAFDDVIPAEEAKQRWPEHADVIERNKSTEPSVLLGGAQGAATQLGWKYTGIGMERDMVLLRTCWERNQPLGPMSPDEAIATGQVRVSTEFVTDEQTGEAVSQQVFATADGTLTDPTLPDWPQRVGIRQTQILAGKLIDDRECPYRDIPILWNINIPIPHEPYGQGEPQRLESLAQGFNRLVSVLLNIVRYYQSPRENIPQSVKNALGDSFKQSGHAHPGRQLVVPDSLLLRFGGKVSFTEDMPELPTSYMELARWLFEIQKFISGHTDVLQGEAKAGASGRLVQALQEAARGVIGFKARNTAFMLRHMVRLVVGMIVDFLPAESWRRHIKGYPPQVIEALRTRAKSFEYDVKVDVLAGRGSSKQSEREQAQWLAQLNKLSTVDLYKALEVPDAEGKFMRLMQEMGLLQAGQEQEQEQEQEPSESPEGGE